MLAEADFMDLTTGLGLMSGFCASLGTTEIIFLCGVIGLTVVIGLEIEEFGNNEPIGVEFRGVLLLFMSVKGDLTFDGL